MKHSGSTPLQPRTPEATSPTAFRPCTPEPNGYAFSTTTTAFRPRTPEAPNGIDPWLLVRPAFGLHEPRPSTTVPRQSTRGVRDLKRPATSPQPGMRTSGAYPAAWPGEFDRPATATSIVSKDSHAPAGDFVSPVAVRHTGRGLRPTTRPASLFWSPPPTSSAESPQVQQWRYQRPSTRRSQQQQQRLGDLSSPPSSYAVGLPYYAPTPKQAALRTERRHMYCRKREKARLHAIERGEPFWRGKSRSDRLAAEVVRESQVHGSAPERGEVRFLPTLPKAAELARETWAWDAVQETSAERHEAVAAVHSLRSDPAALVKIIAVWKAPSMEKQLAAKFKELKLGAVGRDPKKSLMRSLSAHAVKAAADGDDALATHVLD